MNIFNGAKFLAITVLSVTMINSVTAASVVMQKDVAQSTFDRGYLSIFGGGGTTHDNNFTQSGTALYGADSGGPLVVNAQSKANPDSGGIAGMHLGYKGLEWQFGKEESPWAMIPAAEFEGYYLGVTETGTLLNPTNRIPEHTFVDSFPMNAGIFLANAVFTFNTAQMKKLHPYVGGGVGGAILSISGANSSQVNPIEPGINHFNSNPNASDWTFAAQAKAGVQYDIADHWRVFGEYRYLYLSPTNYTFGSTQYASHIATTNWGIHFAGLGSNVGSAGIQYYF